MLVDRAAVELEVDHHVVADRRRRLERRDVLRALRRRADVNSRTSAKLRSAWMPPAVAQAPIVTRRFDCARTSRIRSASSRVVTEPSTSDRSYGPVADRARRLEEVRDLDLPGDREQLVLAVEQAQLAAVARGELPDRELRLRASQLRHREQRLDRGVREHRPVASDEDVGPNWQRPHWPSAHFMLRSIERWTRSAGRPPRRGLRGEAHHHLRPAHEGGRRRRVDPRHAGAAS